MTAAPAITNGWTGGQYSLLRALLGLVVIGLAGGAAVAPAVPPSGVAGPWAALSTPLAALLAHPAPWIACACACACLGVLLLVGLADRAAAVVAWLLGCALLLARPALWTIGLAPVGWLLLVHALTPPAPYGSWAARGRADPAGGWRLPATLYTAARVMLVVVYAGFGAGRLAGASWVPGLSEGVLAGLWALAECTLAALMALVPALRPTIWSTALVAEAALLLATGEAAAAGALTLLHLIAFDPAWVAPRPRSAAPDRMFYDGHCGLCHRAVRFILAEDPAGTAVRFAPLGGPTFGATVGAEDRAALPDSVVVATASGQLLLRADAIAHLLRRLGGVWRLLAVPLSLLRPAADAAYDLVARLRGRLFAPPPQTCPVVPPRLARRFDP